MMTRRRLIQSIAASGPSALAARAAAQQPARGGAQQANAIGTPVNEPLSASVLPRGIRARFVNNVNGIRMHILEAGYETPNRPAVLMVHGYPELAYSWRKLMPIV